jgi:PsbN protein
METATVLNISIAVVLIAIAGISIYTSFGPPAKQLRDPFDDHDD